MLGCLGAEMRLLVSYRPASLFWDAKLGSIAPGSKPFDLSKIVSLDLLPDFAALPTTMAKILRLKKKNTKD